MLRAVQRTDPGDVDARHAQLVQYGRISFVTQSGLADLITEVNRDGTPPHSSRATQYRARKNVCSTETEYGTIVNTVPVLTKDGTSMGIGVHNPLATLSHLAATSDDYSTILRRSVTRHRPSPSSPWHLIIYQDGIDPGDSVGSTIHANQLHPI